MKRTILLLNFFFVIAGFHCLFAQTDTVYYQEDWQPTLKSKAAFYRPFPQKEGNGYRVKDYYVSGKLQMDAYSESLEEDKFHGEVIWYYESGAIQQKAQYAHGAISGTFSVYDSDGSKLSEGIYENGEPVEGTYMTIANGYYYLSTYENGRIVREELYAKDKGNKTRAIYTYNGQDISSVAYYDQKGNLIGISDQIVNGYIYNGHMVEFYYNPLAPKTIYEFKDGIAQGVQKHFYMTGELQKEVYTDGNEYEKEVYYDKSGKQLAILTYDGYMPYDGAQYAFMHDSDRIASITPYSNGRIEGEYIKFHENGQMAENIPYVAGHREGNAQFYNKEGKLLHEGVYKNDFPYEGTFNGFFPTEVITYSAGKRLVEKTFYSNGVLQKEHIIGKSSIMYDSLGNEIAKLTYKDGYPYEGKLIEMYNDLISSISTYKNGALAAAEIYENGLPYETTFYNKDYGYEKKISYYANGKIKKEVFYEEYYIKEEKAYGKSGELLGAYTATPVKSGKEVIFSNENILKINEYKAGALINEAKYNIKGQLLYKIVSDGESLFYDNKGHLISKATYKEGLPYEGTVYKYDDYSENIKEITTYQEGVPHGEQRIYVEAYFNEAPILSQTFTFNMGIKEGPATRYSNGKISEMMNYKDGFLDGEAKFYNEEGVLHSTSYYNAGKPEEGVFYEYDYSGSISHIKTYSGGEPNGLWQYYDYRGLYQEKIYKDGELIESRDYENGEVKAKLIYKNERPYEGTSLNYNIISHYFDGSVIKVSEYADWTYATLLKEREYGQNGTFIETEFYENGNIKAVVSYQSSNDYYDEKRHGEAMFYAQDGKKIAEGIYDEGMPINGNFIFYHYVNPKNFIRLSIGKGKYVADFYEGNEHAFTIEAKQAKSAKPSLKLAEEFIAILTSRGDYIIN